MLLFDQNISHRIITLLEDTYNNIGQVRILGLGNKTDIEIWNYAKNNNYCIVTFDSDFINISTLYGTPPKIIWLRMGNCTTKEIAKILINKQEIIFQFLNNENYSKLTCLEID